MTIGDERKSQWAQSRDGLPRTGLRVFNAALAHRIGAKGARVRLSGLLKHALTGFITAWTLMAAIVLTLVTAVEITAVGAFLVWYVGTRVIALVMRSAGTGIRSRLPRR